MEHKANESEPIVNHKTGETKSQLLAKLPVPGPGKSKETEADKIKKRAIKELIEEYRDGLAQALPDIRPVQIKKALEGDLTAIKNIEDRVLGKPEQKSDITSNGESINQVLVKFINERDSDHTNPDGV